MPLQGVTQPKKEWVRRQQAFHWLAIFGVAVILFVTASHIDHLNQSKFHQQERAEVLAQLSLIKSQLEGKLFSNLQTVQGLVAAIIVEPDMSQARFSEFAKPLFNNRTQLGNIAAAPNLVISMIYPLDNNRSALGLNYMENPAQREAALRVKDSGKPVVAGPVSLVQGGTGFIGRIPVFLPAKTIEQKPLFWGLVSAVIDSEQLYNASGLTNPTLSMNIAIRGKDGLGSSGNIFYGDPDIFKNKPQTLTILLPGGTWQIAATPKEGWTKSADDRHLYLFVFSIISAVILIPLIITSKISQKRSHQQQLLQDFFDLSPIGITLNDFRSGNFIDVNRAALVPGGYTKEEFLKLNNKDISPERYIELDKAQSNKVKTEGRYGPYEKMLKTKNGSEYPVLINGMLLKDTKGNGLVWSMIEDISARREAEKQLTENHKQLELVIDMLKAIADAQSGMLMQKNTRDIFEELLTTILNLTGSEFGFIGEIFYKENGDPWLKTHAKRNIDWSEETDSFYSENVLDVSDLNKLKNSYKNAISTLKPVVENNLSNNPREEGPRNGFSEIHNFLAIPTARYEECTGLIGIANRTNGYDNNLISWLEPLVSTIGQIFENLRMIRAREKAEKEIVSAKIAAESAVTAKSEFLAMMSHEIRTPMNGVIGMLNLLKRSNLEKEQLRKLNIAKMSADSLLTIINDILDFSKVDAGKLELEYLDFDIRTFLGDFAESVAIRAQEKDIELMLDIAEIDDSHIRGDPSRLRQLLSNIVGNAIKFTDGGEIVIYCNMKKLSDDVFKLHISVTDTGIGIPEKNIPFLFSPFTQVDASTTRKYGGTGLGLAICKKLCEQMGGSISVKSDINSGSCFSFEVIFEKSEKSNFVKPVAPVKGKHILIVDDSHNNCKLIAKQLAHWGAKSSLAHNAVSAMKTLENKSITIDLILIDDNLPELNGVKLAKNIRDISALKEIPIAIMTDMSHRLSESELNNLGIGAAFPKPVIAQDYDTAISLLKNKINSSECHFSKEALLTTEGHATQINLHPWKGGTRILLVEDNNINQEVACMILEDFDLVIDVANDGKEALLALREAEQTEKYALIFMDCQMPIMDGYEATQAIRRGDAGEYCRKIPVIAMTANAMKGDREKCIQAGMDDYLSKPIEQEDLYNKLTRWISKS